MSDAGSLLMWVGIGLGVLAYLWAFYGRKPPPDPPEWF